MTDLAARLMTAPAQDQPRSFAGSAPALFLWAAAIALSPVHLFAPGLPQLPHALLGVFVLLALTGYFAPFRYDPRSP